MSAKMGFAPVNATDSAVATKEKLGTMTSSPGPMPRAMREAWRAAVPELTATARFAPTKCAKSLSNCETFGPDPVLSVRIPLFKIFVTILMSSFEIDSLLIGMVSLKTHHLKTSGLQLLNALCLSN